MAIERLSQASIGTLNKYSSMLAGSQPILPGFELIATTVLSSDASSVTFNSLGDSASQFKHLQLRAVYGSSNAGGTYIRLQFNNDNTGSYSFHFLYGQGSSVLSTSGATQSAIHPSPISGTGSLTQTDAVIIDILNFSNPNMNTTTRALSGYSPSSINVVSGLWFKTNPVTSINLLAYKQGSAFTFSAGTRFSLYGVRG